MDIAKALPEWFDENEITEISIHLANLSSFVAVNSDKVIAFAIMDDTSEDSVEIKHIAVSKDSQNMGYGTKLLEHIEDLYSTKKFIEVKTLDESAEYEPYIRTRAFYENNGFKKVGVIDPYPGWSPGNPCAVYRKQLNGSDGK